MSVRSSFVSTVLVTVAVAFGARAAETSLTPEQMASAVRLESLSIPTPGEFFAAINKIDRPNWSQFDRPGPLSPTTSRARLSLNVGTRVADGFIAVEAQDGQQVKNTGRDIVDLAKGLGVSESILARGNSIGDFAENNEWTSLKEELEATENEVKLQMAAQKDDPLITLVSLGAWLRGTQATSDVVVRKYSPEASELLHQPAIISYLLELTEALPQRLREDALVGEVEVGVRKIAEITATAESGVLSEASVGEIFQTSSNLVNLINSPETPLAP